MSKQSVCDLQSGVNASSQTREQPLRRHKDATHRAPPPSARRRQHRVLVRKRANESLGDEPRWNSEELRRSLSERGRGGVQQKEAWSLTRSR